MNVVPARALLLLALPAVLFLSCPDPVISVDINPQEVFTEDEAPGTVNIDGKRITLPWGYDRPENAERPYPFFVSGSHNEGVGYYRAYAQRYPAFVLSHASKSQGDGRDLALVIKAAMEEGLRIDLNRLYITGFSAGGSGSFPTAKGMQEEGLYFAAINRVAGQSQSDLGNDIATKTAVWYHIGLNDGAARVSVARASLKKFRDYPCNSGAREHSIDDAIDSYQRETVYLERGNYDMFIYSEYTGMGHTRDSVYKDPDIFPWMFSHSLALR